MRRRALLLAAAAALCAPRADAQTIAAGSGHGHYSAPPPPESLGGAFVLSDVGGTVVTPDSLKGGWTLMFFGYSRCRSACPVALPTIAEAARRLRGEGLAVRAAFVDIDQPPVGAPQPRSAVGVAPSDPLAAHAGHEGFAAAREIAQRFGGRLMVLTGTRGQIRRAIELYQVRIDHVPARAGETGHSLNHTTLVYVIGPDGRVAGYLHHAEPPQRFVDFVKSRAGA